MHSMRYFEVNSIITRLFVKIQKFTKQYNLLRLNYLVLLY